MAWGCERGPGGRRCISMHMADSLCCAAEMNTNIVKQLYYEKKRIYLVLNEHSPKAAM